MTKISYIICLITFFNVCLVRADSGEVQAKLSFKDHHFEPQRLELPANQRVLLTVENLSAETIEFESFKLNREKPVERGQTIEVHLPALSSGSYDFYDDFHKDVPEGEIIVR